MNELEDTLRRLVERHWHHRSVCGQVYWIAQWQTELELLRCHAAPVLQEVFGGEDDGQIHWTAIWFEFDAFGCEPEIEIQAIKGTSVCIPCDFVTPFVAMRVELNGEPFELLIHLAPIPTSPPLEILDMLTGQVRPIEKGHDPGPGAIDDDSIPF